MREYIEIGGGREARRGYSLDAVSLQPSRRTRSSKDVDVSWHIDAYTFDIPFLSYPSDALSSPEFVIEMGKQGGLGVWNAEGIFARHADPEAVIEKVHGAFNGEGDAAFGGFGAQGSSVVRTLQEAAQQSVDLDLVAERIAEIRASGVTVAARVSPQHCRELAPTLIKAGVELLVVQGAIISAEHVDADGDPLNLKEFIRSVDVPVIAGDVYDYTTAMHLMRAGAVGVIVSGGNDTEFESLGIAVPFATAITDVAAARRDYLDETGGRYVHVIADTLFENSGLAIKAIACGADAVMLGGSLAQVQEAPGKGAFWAMQASHPKLPRGWVAPSNEPDEAASISLQTVLHGPSTATDGSQNFVGALKRAMAKCGFTDLKKFQRVELSVR